MIFCATQCIFQDLVTRRTRAVVEHMMIYICWGRSFSLQNKKLVKALRADSTLRQWHRRPGHPPFWYSPKTSLCRQCSSHNLLVMLVNLRSMDAVLIQIFLIKAMLLYDCLSQCLGPFSCCFRLWLQLVSDFNDCFSRVTWDYLLHHKSDVFSYFNYKMVAM